MCAKFHSPINKVPYFFGYKTKFYSFQNSPKNLDPSYKMDLHLWDCLGRVELVFYQNFIALMVSFVVILERGKLCLIAEKFCTFYLGLEVY